MTREKQIALDFNKLKSLLFQVRRKKSVFKL